MNQVQETGTLCTVLKVIDEVPPVGWSGSDTRNLMSNDAAYAMTAVERCETHWASVLFEQLPVQT